MDIRFKKITLHHFLSYDHAEVALNDKGFCLVRGINRSPRDSAKSNGSGKSAIFNAISYALTGETLQGLKSNLANIEFNDGCWVELEFSVDGHDYKLTRSKEDSKLGTDLKIAIDGQDKSGKGIRESSELLAQYLPDLTSELIGSVILIGQNMPMKFTANTPSGRKEVLEHLTQSDYMIQDLKDRITGRMDALSAQIRAKEDSLLSESSKNEILTSQLDKYKREYAERYAVQKDYEGIIAQMTSEIVGHTEQLKDTTTALVAAQAKVDELSPQVQALLEAKFEETNRKTLLRNTLYANISTRRAELRANSLTLEKEISDMENIRDVCPTCGRPFEGVVKPDPTAKKTELAKVNAQLEALRSEESSAERVYNEDVAAINLRYAAKIKEKDDEIAACTHQENDLTSKHAQLTALIANKRLELQKVISERDAFEDGKRKLAGDIANAESQIKLLSESMGRTKADKALLEEHMAAVSKMNTIVKRDFRGFLLKNIIDYIDAKAKSYASRIFGCDDVSFVLDGNNIGISFCGKDYENLSGGEKQRLDLIIQFAIREFISQYLDFSCNILVLDEITDALDRESCDKVINFIIEELSSIESVFIISHHADELELPKDSDLLIEKGADGVSKVVIG